ncbi:MAG: MarR family transcriptional regulator [Chloroflexi bacterium]|nr:MarR family transcriptional regulator [Chloroflexota bacterium]
MPRFDDPEALDHLVAQVCHLHYSRARELLDRIGLYRGQPALLGALWEQEGLSHTELADRLQVTPATITRMLQRMEKAALLVRVPDVEDQRVSRVYLTDAGREIRGRVEEVWRAMDAETFAGFSPEERADVQRVLFRMRENLTRASEAGLSAIWPRDVTQTERGSRECDSGSER